jgi:multiple sugar transport system ATP-binding protein
MANSAPTPGLATGGLRKFMNRLSGANGGRPQDPTNGAEAGRHHRKPAELAVRLAPYPAVGPGHPLAVSVRVDALHFFEEQGKRIDVGWR